MKHGLAHKRLAGARPEHVLPAPSLGQTALLHNNPPQPATPQQQAGRAPYLGGLVGAGQGLVHGGLHRHCLGAVGPGAAGAAHLHQRQVVHAGHHLWAGGWQEQREWSGLTGDGSMPKLGTLL